MSVMHYQHKTGFILCVTGDAEEEGMLIGAFDEILAKEKPHVLTKPVTHAKWINSPHRDPHPMFQIRCRGQYADIVSELTARSDTTTVSPETTKPGGG